MEPTKLFTKFIARLIIIGIISVLLSEKSFSILNNDENSNVSGSISHNYAGTARSISLGGANVADVQGIESIYDNPAGLALINQYTIGFLHSNLFENTYYNFIGYVHPLKTRGSIGFGWAGLNSSGFEIRDSANVDSGTFDDSQNVFFLGYGNAWQKNLQAGVNLKILQHNIYRTRNTGFGLDLGIQYHWYENLTAGINFQNILSLPLLSEESSEPLPFFIKSGISWNPKTQTDWINNIRVNVGFDLVDVWGNQGGITEHLDTWKIGCEYNFFDILYVRGGLQDNSVSLGLGATVYNIFLDYACDLKDFGTLHWISLTMAIGKHVDRALMNKYYQEAQKAYQQGEYKAAIKVWERIILMNPEDSTAKRYLEKTQGKLQTELDSIMVEADSCSHEGEHSTAVAILQKGLKLDPDEKRIKIKITMIKSLQEAKERQELADNIRRHEAFAREYYQKQELLKALDEWKTVLALDKNHIAAAERIWAIKSEINRQIDQHFYQGIQNFNQKKYTEAIKYFQIILETDPDYHMAGFYLQKTRKLLSHQLHKTYFAGQKWMKQRSYQKAFKCFKSIVKTAPEYKDTLSQMKKAEIKIKEISKILSQYKKAKKYQKQKKPSAALDILAPLIRKDVYNYKISTLYNFLQKTRGLATRHYTAGIEYYRDKKIKLAINSFRKSLELDKQSETKKSLIEAYTSQGILAYRRDELSKALSAWQKVLIIDKDQPMIKRYIKRAVNKRKNLKRLFGE